jgi:hypothetical protein
MSPRIIIFSIPSVLNPYLRSGLRRRVIQRLKKLLNNDLKFVLICGPPIEKY